MSEYMATSPLIEAGNVYLPHPMYVPWVNDFIEECAAFPVRDLAVAIATRGADWTMLLAVEAEGPNRQVHQSGRLLANIARRRQFWRLQTQLLGLVHACR